MPAKKTNSSTADKVKATSTKAVKSTAKPATKSTATKPAKPAKKAPAKPTPIAAVKTKKISTKAPATPKTSSAPAQAPVDQAPVIPREEIQLRAYFISERRETMGWPGNSSTDWIEAEAQLIAEAKRRLKKTI